MEGGVLQSDAFAAFAKDYILFCHITTRVKSDPHQELLHEKGGHGFPYMIYMDAAGEVLAEPGGRSVEAFRKTGKECENYVRVRARAKAGAAGAKTEYALLRMEFGKLSLEAGLAAIGKAELTEAQQARLDRVKVEGEIAATLASIEDDTSSDAAGERFYALVKAGKDGPTRDQDRYSFYVLVLHAAEAKKDADTFEQAYLKLKASFEGYPGAASFLKVVELRLAELKK